MNHSLFKTSSSLAAYVLDHGLHAILAEYDDSQHVAERRTYRVHDVHVYRVPCVVYAEEEHRIVVVAVLARLWRLTIPIISVCTVFSFSSMSNQSLIFFVFLKR